MSDLILRTATPDDAPLILAMLRELAIYEKVPENGFRLTQDMRVARHVRRRLSLRTGV